MSTDNFYNQFTEYKDYAPAGVLLPKIEIDAQYYSKLGIDADTSNYDFLRRLCLDGVSTKGIDKLPNKQDY